MEAGWPVAVYLPAAATVATLAKQSGIHVDNGRVIAWRLLLYTRAIVPARVTAGLWPKAVSLRWGGRSVLLLAAVSAAVFIAVRLSQRELPVQAPAIEPLRTTVPPGPAPRVHRW